MHRFGWSSFVGVVLCAASSIVVVASVTAPAAADDRLDQQLSNTDTNHDKRIDQTEYRRRMVEVFYLADDNKDGLLVIEELREQEPVSDEAFANADKNHDGKLSMQEFIEYRMIDFSKADTNGDGILTIDEIEAWNASHPR